MGLSAATPYPLFPEEENSLGGTSFKNSQGKRDFFYVVARLRPDPAKKRSQLWKSSNILRENPRLGKDPFIVTRRDILTSKKKRRGEDRAQEENLHSPQERKNRKEDKVVADMSPDSTRGSFGGKGEQKKMLMMSYKGGGVITERGRKTERDRFRWGKGGFSGHSPKA